MGIYNQSNGTFSKDGRFAGHGIIQAHGLRVQSSSSGDTNRWSDPCL
jgi:hypothetical protein